MGVESALNMVMQDTQGLEERLGHVVSRGNAVAGAFFSTDGSLLAAYNFTEEIAEVDQAIDAEAPLRWTETLGGEPVLVTTAAVMMGDLESEQEHVGHVMVAVPAQALRAQKSTSMLISLIVPVLIALLAWVILVQVTRTVIRPLETLRTATDAIEKGDLSTRVVVERQDEIGALAASFNKMVEASERSTNALQVQRVEAEKAQAQAEELRRTADEERSYLQAQFEHISSVVSGVTQGNLTQRLTITRDDDVGALMRQINQMIHDLEDLIGEVHKAGNQLSEAANKVARSAEEMSSGAQEQANETIEVAAAVEEMSVTIAESSRNAYDANEMAQRASSLASEGEDVFRKTTQGMKRIATIVQGSAEKVTALGDSSAQIGEIIQVIRDIADQTNLLALNAAIEAARAGDQGRGFAVVADEVRKLAERTSEATKQIGDMITRIQHNTDEVVASMTRGNEEVATGLRQADEASHSLSEILASINRMVLMIDQIAAASQEQSTASSQISARVESISSVATEVSSSTVGLSSTAEAMNQRVATLRQIIERFSVSDADASPAAFAIGDGAAAFSSDPWG